MIRWNKICSSMRAWVLLVGVGVIAGLSQPATAQQDGPAVSPAPRASVDAEKLTGSQGLQTDTLELAVNSTRAVTVTGYSEIIVGAETVANVNVDPRRPSKIFIFGRAIGATNVFFLDRRGNVVRQIEVFVTLDNGGVKSAIARLLPDEAIQVTSFRDTIFLSGNVRSAAAAHQAVEIARRFVEEDDNIKNMMTVIGSQQVVLQVRVSEMARTIRKQLSADLDITKAGGGFSIATAVPDPTTAYITTIGAEISGSLTDTPTFRFLEGKNLIKTLAEPTLTALSGETATFLSGGEVPHLSKLTSDGLGSFEFREYGIRLEFLPVVKDEGLISLNVNVEISSLDWENALVANQADSKIPALFSKKTATTVDLPSGGSLMIAGLLQDDDENDVKGVPLLKDIPLLGTLFRTTEFVRKEKELVVTVTAYLASSTDSTTPLASPTDGFEPASDLDIYLLGKLQKSYGKRGEPIWANPLAGPYGYIMK